MEILRISEQPTYVISIHIPTIVASEPTQKALTESSRHGGEAQSARTLPKVGG